MNGLPIVGLVTAVGFLVMVVELGLKSLRQRRSQSWPWAETIFERGRVERAYRRRGGSFYVLTVTYSYSVAGKKYGGIYTERCRTESEAQHVMQSLQKLPPPARYEPGHPSKSVMDPYRDAALAVMTPRRDQI